MDRIRRFVGVVGGAAFAAVLSGCGGSDTQSLDLTVTSIVPGLLPATHSVPFTAVGTGWGILVGQNAKITFTATSGTPFAGGTSATAFVIGTVTSATTIEASSPVAAFCGLVVTANVSVLAITGDEAVSAGPIAVFFAPSTATFAPNPVRATIAEPFTLTGTDFDPVGGIVDVQFTAATGTPFLDGTSAVVHRTGVIISDTTIVGVTPLAVTEEDFLAAAKVTFASGACAVSGPLPFRAPPVVRAVAAQPGVNFDTSGHEFLACVPQKMTVIADNLDPLSEVTVFDAAIGPTKPIGAGVLGSPVVTVVPGAFDDQIAGMSPTDPDQTADVEAVVRVTNPDGQFADFDPLGVLPPVVFQVSGALVSQVVADVPGESPGVSIAINPKNPLNVAVASQTGPDATTNNIRLAVTMDGGLTWTNVPLSVGVTADTPRVAFDAHGNLYLAARLGTDTCFLQQRGNGGLVGGATSTFTFVGRTVDPSIDIATGPSTAVPGREAVVVAAAVSTTGVVLMAHTSDGLAQFAGAGLVTVSDGTICFQPTVAIAPGGAVYVAWAENIGLAGTEVQFDADLDGVDQAGFAFGTDRSLSFAPGWGPRFPIQASPAFGAPHGPQIAVVHGGDHVGRVVVSYTHLTVFAALDVVTKVSDDFGDTFFGIGLQPARVHPASSGDQFGGALAADPTDPDGRIYATWYDTGPVAAGTLATRWASSSTDGLQWSDPVRLSLGPAPGSDLTDPAYTGDYGYRQGAAARDGCAWAAWTEQRGAPPESGPGVTRFQVR